MQPDPTQGTATAAAASPKVTLIIPVYNEEGNLPALLEEIEAAMRGQPRTWEVLFVDDGSSDQSLAVLKRLAQGHEFVRFLSFSDNCGQSTAFAAGFADAGGEIFVTLDADLQNDPADIPAMLTLYEQGYDMVIGWRAHRQDSWSKRTASKIGNAVRNALSHEQVKDTGCSLKILRASLARKLPMFKGMHRFLPTLMKLEGAQVVEVKVNHRPRLHGSSKYGVLERAVTGFFDLLAIRWMQRRHRGYVIRERKEP